MEKLLLMGVSTDTPYVLEYTKRIGVWTIITDNLPSDSHRAKKDADELWRIDVKELDALEEKCKKEKITAVYSGNHELCLDYTKALCERLGLPFYASNEVWTCARDKALFKEVAQECGMVVPKRYFVDEQMLQSGTLGDISYPVIVKPVDAAAAKGITICQSEEGLLEAYRFASENSGTRRVVIEDYITGTLLHATYVVKNGKPELLTIQKTHAGRYGDDVYPFGKNVADGEEFEHYKNQTDEAVRKLTRKLNCQNGVLLLQAIFARDTYYVFEMGYRLDGTGTWLFCEKLCGVNLTEYMVNLALGRDNVVKRQNTGKIGAQFMFATKEGYIKEVRGLNEIMAMSDVEFFRIGFGEGQCAHATKGLVNIAYIMKVYGDNEELTVQKLAKIRKTLHHFDSDGKEMLHFDILGGAGSQS